MNKSDERDFIEHWLMEMEKIPYKEPILDSKTALVVLDVCKRLQQNAFVFVRSIDIVEDYIRVKNDAQQRIDEPLMVTLVATLMAHKCEGAQDSLTVKHMASMWHHLSGRHCQHATIMRMETEIMKSLNYHLPISSAVEDLFIIVHKYAMDESLIDIVKPVCLNILKLIYVERITWFEKLKMIYSKNDNFLVVFRQLMTNKFYLPLGIFVAALTISSFPSIINVNLIVDDASNCTNIHQDHISILSAIFIDLIHQDNST